MQTFLEPLRCCAKKRTFDSDDPDCKTVLDQLYAAYEGSNIAFKAKCAAAKLCCLV